MTIQASGFKDQVFDHLVLQARDTQRIDANLAVGAASQTVEVQAAGDVITTDTSSLASTKTTHELVDLPVAVYSRSNGSTSPLLTLTTEPGVQVDDNSQPGDRRHYAGTDVVHHRWHQQRGRGKQRPNRRTVSLVQLHLRDPGQRDQQQRGV